MFGSVKPTPTEKELVLRAQIKELHERKAIVACSVFVDDVETVNAELIAVRVRSREGVQGHHRTG